MCTMCLSVCCEAVSSAFASCRVCAAPLRGNSPSFLLRRSVPVLAVSSESVSAVIASASSLFTFASRNSGSAPPKIKEMLKNVLQSSGPILQVCIRTQQARHELRNLNSDVILFCSGQAQHDVETCSPRSRARVSQFALYSSLCVTTLTRAPAGI